MPSDRRELRQALETLAFSQEGFFTAAQARDAGYSYQAQKYQVDSGNWTRLDRGIFRLHNWPDSPTDDYTRWTLWSGGRGVLSHDTALHIHHLSDVDPAKIHLTVPRGFRATDPLIVAHIGEISESDREEHGSWSVTTPLRTLADVAGSDLSQEHVDSAVSDALDQGVVSRRALLRRASTLSERPALRLERALKNAEEHNGDQ